MERFRHYYHDGNGKQFMKGVVAIFVIGFIVFTLASLIVLTVTNSSLEDIWNFLMRPWILMQDSFKPNMIYIIRDQGEPLPGINQVKPRMIAYIIIPICLLLVFGIISASAYYFVRAIVDIVQLEYRMRSRRSD